MIRQAVFLVGGKGTRLGEIARNTPKPLLSVAGRPFLDHLIEHWCGTGLNRFLLLAGHCGDQVERYAADWRVRNVDVSCIVEPEPAGTGGALHYARGKLDEHFVVANGDTFFDINPQLLADADQDKPLVTLALRHHSDAGRYGSVTCDGPHIIRFNEKANGGPGLINGGIYLIKRELLDIMPPPPCSIEQQVFPALTAARRINGRVFDAPFIDIGVPEDLHRAQHLFAQQRL